MLTRKERGIQKLRQLGFIAENATVKTQSEAASDIVRQDALQVLSKAAEHSYGALEGMWKSNYKAWKAKLNPADFQIIEAHKDDLKANLDQQPKLT